MALAGMDHGRLSGDEDAFRCPPTVADLLDAYTSEYLPHQAAKTRYQKVCIFARLRQELGALPLPALTPAVLRRWRDQLSTHLAPGSVCRYLHVFSSALTVAVRDYEWLPSNPMHRVHKPALGPKRVRFLTLDEQARLLTESQRSRCAVLYPLVLLALTTGLRRNEALTLRWQEVDLEQGLLRLVRTKTGVRRAVPMPQMTIAALRQWRDTQAPPRLLVFAGRTGTRPAEVSRAWYYAVARAGIEDFRFHDLRHTAASYLAMSGIRLEDIAEVLGHKSLQTSRRYRHLTTAYTAALVEKMAQEFVGKGDHALRNNRQQRCSPCATPPPSWSAWRPSSWGQPAGRAQMS